MKVLKGGVNFSLLILGYSGVLTISGRDVHKKSRASSDNHIKGTSKHAMRVHGMLGKETNLNLGGAL